MSREISTSSSNGIGFCGLLTLVFVIFKLLGKLDWSWWWVFSPILISTGFAILILGIVLLIGILAWR
jgi:hypothetical protein